MVIMAQRANFKVIPYTLMRGGRLITRFKVITRRGKKPMGNNLSKRDALKKANQLEEGKRSSRRRR